MIKLLKQLYRLKISAMFLFSLGFSELATPIAVVRDVGIILAALDILFHIHFSFITDVIICVVSFGVFILLGFILKTSGMSMFATKVNNSVSPEMQLIRQIAKKLNIEIVD